MQAYYKHPFKIWPYVCFSADAFFWNNSRDEVYQTRAKDKDKVINYDRANE